MTSGLGERAEELARRAHAGQVDKLGDGYFEAHLRPIAELLRPFGEYASAAGVLHDIVEDTATTYDDLRAAGIPEPVVSAVRSVTRVEGEPYEALIARAAAHPLGRLVKLADNWHNLQGQAALAQVDPETSAALRERYERARETLTAALL
ncbi:guanosine-3',5'-bis(diphosphate) 3'-pyrophosphohydrolase [Spongisporangium articulatum]|uniref:Guanosine-3',5'-bis(Diphosphate) 3'-pyrophosphohydrolase n=1 Tax=Spongisporangium articulatum TaxID=3362603 RepID=A0ABW8AHU7_9ACTN